MFNSGAFNWAINQTFSNSHEWQTPEVILYTWPAIVISFILTIYTVFLPQWLTVQCVSDLLEGVAHITLEVGVVESLSVFVPRSSQTGSCTSSVKRNLSPNSFRLIFPQSFNVSLHTLSYAGDTRWCKLAPNTLWFFSGGLIQLKMLLLLIDSNTEIICCYMRRLSVAFARRTTRCLWQYMVRHDSECNQLGQYRLKHTSYINGTWRCVRLHVS